MKWIGILFLMFVIVLAGCGSAKDDNNSEEERITIGTGGTSGTYYPLGVAMAQQIFDDIEGVSGANAVSTGASVANAQKMGEGDYQLALIQNDIAYYSVSGETRDGFEGEANGKIMGLGSIQPAVYQLCTD